MKCTSSPAPVYEFSIRHRAAIQLLTNAIEHIAGQMLRLETAAQREANCHAAQILWQCRERTGALSRRAPPTSRRCAMTGNRAVIPAPSENVHNRPARTKTASDMSTVERFLRYLEGQLGQAPNTVLAYGQAMTDFENWLGQTALKADRQQIYGYLAYCSDRSLSPVTVAHRLSVLRHFYSFALDQGAVREDPTYNVKGPKLQQKLPVGALTVKDIAKMLKTAGTKPQGLRDQVIVLLGFDAGLRESEMAYLALDAVQLKDGLIRIRHGKGDKNATLPILPVLARALRRYLKHGRPQLLKNRQCPYLLIDRNGTAMSRQAVWKRIQAISREALGRSTSPHKLRAGFCTALNDGGMDVRSVQSLMRHADLSTTQRYINLDVKQLRRAYYKSFPRAKR